MLPSIAKLQNVEKHGGDSSGASWMGCRLGILPLRYIVHNVPQGEYPQAAPHLTGDHTPLSYVLVEAHAVVVEDGLACFLGGIQIHVCHDAKVPVAV